MNSTHRSALELAASSGGEIRITRCSKLSEDALERRIDHGDDATAAFTEHLRSLDPQREPNAW
jgi:hypothetical protein